MNNTFPILTKQECGERRQVDTFFGCVTITLQTEMFVVVSFLGWGQFIYLGWSFSFWFTFQSRYQLILDFYQLDQTNTPKLCSNTP
jgi:hypothetical protein